MQSVPNLNNNLR